MGTFAEEARTRLANLLRMAGDSARDREQIIAYVAATPDPPPLGPRGIVTSGCPQCHATMWGQRDSDGRPISVCSRCGCVKESDHGGLPSLPRTDGAPSGGIPGRSPHPGHGSG
ncbi:hypothetical protein [Streptomyces sp. NPDC058773]|uniref:hypothetical protein n=1 Tax=Streptomyces sp. NPDC058773 TaxID=3346632 RepID=UPI003678CDB8